MIFVMEYDEGADALYIRLTDADNQRVVESDEVASGIIVDYNEKGDIVGIEILWFSQRSIDLSKLIVEGPRALVEEV